MDMDNMKKIIGDAIEKAKEEEKLSEEDKAVADKAADLIKKSGFDKTLKELEKDD